MFLKSATRDQIMDYFNNLDRNKTSIEADLKDVKEWDVTPGNFTVVLNGTPYRFRHWAQTQLLRKLRIPQSYFEICSKELRDKELKEGIENLSRGSRNQFKIWVDPETNEQNVYGFIPTKCRDMLTGQIMEQVLNGMGSQMGVYIDEFDSSLEEMRCRFVNKNTSYIDVDEEFPAVDFVFSEVLKQPIKLQSVLYRKACSNGLVIPQEINQSFSMPLPRFKPDVFDLNIQYVDDAASGLEQIAQSFESLKNIQLPEALIESDRDIRNAFDDVFEYVLPSRSLRNEYETLIRTEYNREGNYTVNGMINATTRIARDLEDASKVSLESAAGKFVSNLALMDERTKQNGGTFEYSKEHLDSLFQKKKKLGNAPVGA